MAASDNETKRQEDKGRGVYTSYAVGALALGGGVAFAAFTGGSSIAIAAAVIGAVVVGGTAAVQVNDEIKDLDKTPKKVQELKEFEKSMSQEKSIGKHAQAEMERRSAQDHSRGV